MKKAVTRDYSSQREGILQLRGDGQAGSEIINIILKNLKRFFKEF